MQCEFLVDFQAMTMCCTASMGRLMAEEIEKRGLRDKINLKKMIFGSERSSDSMRERIKKDIQVSGDVEILDYRSLPRFERKSRRVFDNRFAAP